MLTTCKMGARDQVARDQTARVYTVCAKVARSNKITEVHKRCMEGAFKIRECFLEKQCVYTVSKGREKQDCRSQKIVVHKRCMEQAFGIKECF